MVQQHRMRQVEQEDDTPCNPNCDLYEPNESGPVRESGGTTGQGNLSPGQASRTGGTTGGVRTQDEAAPARSGQIPAHPGK